MDKKTQKTIANGLGIGLGALIVQQLLSFLMCIGADFIIGLISVLCIVLFISFLSGYLTEDNMLLEIVCSIIMVPVLLITSRFDMSWFWGINPTSWICWLPVGVSYMFLLFMAWKTLVVVFDAVRNRGKNLSYAAQEAVPWAIGLVFFIVCFVLIKI